MLLWALACAEPETKETCEVLRTTPHADDLSVRPDDPIVFFLSNPDFSAAIEGPVPGKTVITGGGTTVTFVPDEELAYEQAYTFTLHGCGGETPLNFSTFWGEPLPDITVEVRGETYAVDMQTARIVQPPGLGAILSGLVDSSILIHVLDVDATSLQALGAASIPLHDTQDFCSATARFPSADFTLSPDISLGPVTLPLSLAGVRVPVRELAFTGRFSTDGSYIGGITLTAGLDLRDVGAGFPDLGTVDDLCAYADTGCLPCDDGTVACITLEATDLTAVGTAATLEEVAAGDCPGCEVGEPVCL